MKNTRTKATTDEFNAGRFNPLEEFVCWYGKFDKSSSIFYTISQVVYFTGKYGCEFTHSFTDWE